LASSSPWIIKSPKELNDFEYKDRRVIVGVFNTQTDAAALQEYQAMAQAKKLENYYGLVTEKEVPDLAGFLAEAVTDRKKDFVVDMGSNAERVYQGPRVLVYNKVGEEGSLRESVSMFGQRDGDSMTQGGFNAFIDKYLGKPLLPYQLLTPTDTQKKEDQRDLKHVAHVWLKSRKDPSENEVFKLIRQAAQGFHRDVAVVYHDEERETAIPVIGRNVSGPTAMNLMPYGMNAADRPLFGMETIDKDSDEVKVRYSLGHVHEGTPLNHITSFMRKVVGGEARPAVASEAQEENPRAKSVQRLVSSQLEELVAGEGGRDAVISFHWGEPVEDHRRHELELLAQALGAKGSSIAVLQFALGKNDVPRTMPELHAVHAIEGIPQLVYARAPKPGSPGKIIGHPSDQNQTAETIASSLMELIGEKAGAALDAEPSGEEAGTPFLEYMRLLTTAVGSCRATVFEHGEFTGWGVSLPRGSYDAAGLAAKGVDNDGISSVKVSRNCVAKLYENTDKTGWHCELKPGDNAIASLETASCFNDAASAVEIHPFVEYDQVQLLADPTKCKVTFSGAAHRFGVNKWTAEMIGGEWDLPAFIERGGIVGSSSEKDWLRVKVPLGCKVTVSSEQFRAQVFAGQSDDHDMDKFPEDVSHLSISVEGQLEVAAAADPAVDIAADEATEELTAAASNAEEESQMEAAAKDGV